MRRQRVVAVVEPGGGDGDAAVEPVHDEADDAGEDEAGDGEEEPVSAHLYRY